MQSASRIICGLALVLAAPTAHAADPLDRLVAAYSDVLERHDDANLYWRDGTAMPLSDGLRQKSFDQLLKGASILDQLSLPYPVGRLAQPPAVNDDPGRFRNEAFLRKLYGDCRAGEVERQMTTLTWLPKSWGKTIKATSREGVADQLRRVSEEIDALPAAIRGAAFPIVGVLSCRLVADTGQMSMHAYGAAIDLNLKVSDYWLWERKGDQISYRNRMPQEIVDAFERHGFIWGGKWYHYDTMHFEYRPELLPPAAPPLK